ncbi:MAG TPA: selenide, water dikinase SelD [Steroidobacteraceae bacterium]|nr:selenide, water dikinase SelD [Steroidobacteraceae bacterium]
MTGTQTDSPRLTSLSHGGGCGCKIAPQVLSDLLRRESATPPFANLLVGAETADDAAVYRLNETQAVIATTDFFMPIVDDPFDFGRIAACNALSDVYAMGGSPIFALAILGMPINVLAPEVIRDILRGGEAICAEAGIPIAGGHSIDCVEPVYGLAALGVAHPSLIKRNSTACARDVLVLGKPLGVGILSAALKRGQLSADGYRALVDVTTQLNRVGAELAGVPGVHAMTDVTGFGLLGHLLEVCRASRLAARINMSCIPLLPGIESLAASGYVTGASARNWASYASEVSLAEGISHVQQALLCDPQTSGGLLVACAPESVPLVIALYKACGFTRAQVIGEMTEGPPLVTVQP